MGQYSCAQKMDLKKLFVSDTGEAPVHSYRSPSRHSICMDIEPL